LISGTNKTHLTAISRSGNKPASPTLWLNKNGLIKGTVLDYGCGKDPGLSEHGSWDRYDPYFNPDGISRKEYKTIICNYVLNVIPDPERIDVINNIQSLLAKTGIAYISVRRDVKNSGTTSIGTYQENVYIDYQVEHSNSTFCIYRVTKISSS
jgi:2-polyprenyl-3-methyl-5-hydroxy-6-metoxy-1,4-benzoquinol methylase